MCPFVKLLPFIPESMKLLLKLIRIKKAIVTIPNFGHWRTRLSLLMTGKMPITDPLPENWFDTPNIHLCTLKDFELLCEETSIQIIEKISFNSSGSSNILTRFWPNLFGASAIYKISN